MPLEIAKPLGAGLDVYNTTITQTASQLTVPDGANEGTIWVETENVRVTFDGTTPTTSVGMLLSTARTDGYVFGRAHLEAAKFVRATANNGYISVMYRRYE